MQPATPIGGFILCNKVMYNIRNHPHQKRKFSRHLKHGDGIRVALGIL